MCIIVDLFVYGIITAIGATVMWYAYTTLRQNICVPTLKSLLYIKPNFRRQVLMGERVDWCREMDIHVHIGGKFDIDLFAPHVAEMAVNELDHFLWLCDRYNIGGLTHHDVMVLIAMIPMFNIPEARKDYVKQYRMDHKAARFVERYT